MIIRSTNTSFIVLSPPFSPLFNLSCSSAAPCFFPLTINSISMATLTNFLSNPPATRTSKINPLSFHSSFSVPFLPKHSFLPAKCYANRPPPHHHHLVTKATAASGSPTAATTKKPPSDERVQKIHNVEEFDQALKSAKDRLVVVEYAASHSKHSSRIYPFLVELSRTCNDVDFLLVMGDESDATAALCDREKVEKVPHFSFYKSMEKVHEECWVEPDQLMGDVLYYGDNHSGVVQLHSRDDVERLVEDHKADRKLIVLDVGLKHCGPCVKVYPTVVKLSKQMADTVVFARMNGDENESCMEYLKEKDVIEVPTFLFIRDGMIRGRYVGSGKGELIGEILRYQGVRVTY